MKKWYFCTEERKLIIFTYQVAPAYKGVELGVGETVVMKAVTEACGVNLKSLKSKMATLGKLYYFGAPPLKFYVNFTVLFSFC